jgi:hypothetical protein
VGFCLKERICDVVGLGEYRLLNIVASLEKDRRSGAKPEKEKMRGKKQKKTAKMGVAKRSPC